MLHSYRFANFLAGFQNLVVPLALQAGLLLGLAIVAATAGVAASVLPMPIVLPLLGLGAGFLVCGLILFMYGSHGLLSLAILCAAASMAMNAVRITPWMTVSDLCLSIAALLALLSIAERTLSRPAAYVLVGIGLMAVGGLVGGFLSDDPAKSMLFVAQFGIAAAGTTMILQVWAPGRARLESVVWLWVASATVSALYGIIVELDTHSFRRLVGLSVHANHFATIAILALGPALALTTQRSYRLVALAAVMVLVVAEILSGSRAGLLGMMAVFAVWALLSRQLVSLMAPGLVVAVGAIIMFLGVLPLPEGNAIDRLLMREGSSVSVSNASRRDLLDENVARISNNPITGVGFDLARTAHNLYLQVWTSSGLLGLAGLSLVVIGCVMTPVMRVLTSSRDMLLSGLIAGLAGFFVNGFFQTPLWDRYIWFAIGLTLLALRTVEQQAADQDASSEEHAKSWIRSGETK